MRTLFPSRANDPWAELARMQRELTRLMGPFETTRRAGTGVYPPANFYQASDAYLLRMEMPGVDPASIEITNQRNELSIAGERKAPEVEADASFHRRERRFGKFRRTFTLPDAIDADGADASYHDGVLQLLLPKRPEAKPRQISIGPA